MKQFLKFVFATVVGISLWTLLACVVMFISFVGMAVSEGQTTSVRKGSVLRINLNSSIEERAEEANPLAMFMGEEYEPLGLDQLLAAVEEAAANDKVEGIYMEVGTGFGGAKENVKGEFLANGVANPISHKRGVISMARSQDPNSAGSQFYLCLGSQHGLDSGYTVFGQTVQGVEKCMKIKKIHSQRR